MMVRSISPWTAAAVTMLTPVTLVAQRPREHPDHFGPRSQAELDAFADRLVDIAVAHPESRAALSIGNAFSSAAMQGQPDQTAYAGAYDALERMFRVDAVDGFATDRRRSAAWYRGGDGQAGGGHLALSLFIPRFRVAVWRSHGFGRRTDVRVPRQRRSFL